jgi:hypothetical protein
MPGSRGSAIRIALGITIVIGLVSMSVVAPPDTHAALPPATYTWSMEKRFGPDRNLDQLANDPHNTNSSANPARHTVTFNGCTVANTLTLEYAWTIDGLTEHRPIPLCLLTKELSRGVHTVTLRLTDPLPPFATRSVTQTVRVRDIVIVSMGDSAGSGEGSPDVPVVDFYPPRWQSRRCHRSSKAASALTAKAIEDADPHSSVTFVHVACSGAAISERDAINPKAEGGILDPYMGIDPPVGSTPLPSQVSQVRTILGNRAIDALLVQVGANDLEFGTVVNACMIQARCDLVANPASLDPGLAPIVATGLGACDVLPFASAECRAFVTALGNGVAGESSASLFSSKILPLRVKFDVLNVSLALPRAQGGLGMTASRVFVNQYFDPTRGSDGLPCDPAANGLDPFRTLPGFVLAETTFTANTVVPTLNSEIASATARHSWRLITGMAADFRTHGYCSTGRLVNRLLDSFATQGSEHGTVHPNAAGYAQIATRMIPAVRTAVGV